jgi:hypothetical protein
MLVVALAAFIIETDKALPVQDVCQSILEGVAARWNRAGQLPDFHLDQPAVGQALAVLLEQFGLHVGIFDNNKLKVKLSAALGLQTRWSSSLTRWQLLSTQKMLAQACLNFCFGRTRDGRLHEPELSLDRL